MAYAHKLGQWGYLTADQVEGLEETQGPQLEAARRNIGVSLELGVGARKVSTSSAWSGVSSPSIASELDPTSQLCAKLSFSALGIPNLRLKPNIPFSQIRAVCSNMPFKLKKPVDWGMKDLNLSTLNNAIEQLCLHVQSTDKFILRVHLKVNDTCLHCVPIRGREICDPQAPDPSWRPLSLESFRALDIDKVLAGYKVI